MRGQKPVVACRYDEQGEEIREALLRAFRRFAERETERDALPEEETPCLR